MTTILGAGGPIGNELAKILASSNQPFRLVSRKPTPVAGAEALAADLADREQCIQAVAGSSVVHLLVGLKYDLTVWQELWPRIMANTIEACKRAQASLVFFDNVYMYGKVNGPMTEETPYAPCSKKGEIRAKIATTSDERSEGGKFERDDRPRLRISTGLRPKTVFRTCWSSSLSRKDRSRRGWLTPQYLTL